MPIFGKKRKDANEPQGEESNPLHVVADPDGVASPEDGIPPAADDGKMRLKSEMTLLNGCTVIVGCIIGSGIFVSPTGVLENTGSVNLSIIIWIICGIFTMFGAYCYAELGCMIKKSGADYAYIHVTLGPLAAFVRLWIECIIVRPCTGAIQALTFALYIIKPIFPDCSPPDSSSRLLAASCLCLLCFINCYSVRWATKVQDYFTYAKVFALIIIVGTGFYNLFNGQTQHFTWDNTETDISVIGELDN
jgi:L-type amino acid transporter 8